MVLTSVAETLRGWNDKTKQLLKEGLTATRA